jgi:hypothetical protein
VGWLTRIGAGLATVAVAVALTTALRPETSRATGVVDGPVVAVSRPGAPLPLASVRGDLTLRGDCMMLGDAVVFWPAGTSWDEEARSVRFSGDFDGSAPVGSRFEGGGGVFSSDDEFVRDLGAAGEVLQDCLAATGTEALVLAYP